MPKDGYPPAKVALSATNKENAVVSSILLLDQQTTEIEVNAVNQAVAGKWLAQATVDGSVAGTSVITAAGTANWDFIVQLNTVKRFVLPVSRHVSAPGSVQGIGPSEGLFPAVAFKTTAGNGSVLTGQY